MNEHQQFESGWWGDCANTFGEETKQIVYAGRMGLTNTSSDSGKWPLYDLGGKGVVDLGGGPVSMLLKCVNFANSAVVDPCPYPEWAAARYAAHGVSHRVVPAEEWDGSGFDEAWIYNVLQHVEDPERVIARARAAAPVLRIFEWVEHPASLGHPHVLHVHDLNRWIGDGANGHVEILNESGCNGLAYSGAFGG